MLLALFYHTTVVQKLFGCKKGKGKKQNLAAKEYYLS